MGNQITKSVASSLKMWNSDTNSAWTLGDNWSNVGSQFETYVNKYLFPKLNETNLINIDLGNRFDYLAKEVPYVGQYTEEFVIKDAVPVALNLSKDETLMLKRNYPEMITKYYGQGMHKKTKFTLNNNDVRLNFLTLGDAVSYALSVFKKRFSDINVTEEFELKGMLVDYSINQLKESAKRIVGSLDELATKVFESILNIQNNSSKYNEADTASNGGIGRYTTKTKLDDIIILTNDTVKTFLLDTKIANTFNTSGIDFTKKVISFDDLGGVYRITKDTIVTKDIVDLFNSYGDYQMIVGDKIQKGDVITFNATSVISDIEEIKPQSEIYAFVLDKNAIRYKRNTQDMIKAPFLNGEFDEVTYWLHYYSFKAISPFYNKILITGK